MSKLTDVLKAVAKNVHDRFDAANVPHMTLSITIKGRIGGDLEIKYDLCQQYDQSVVGGDLGQVISEYLRRRGWNEANDALLLPAPGSEKASSESEEALF